MSTESFSDRLKALVGGVLCCIGFGGLFLGEALSEKGALLSLLVALTGLVVLCCMKQWYSSKDKSNSDIESSD